MKSRSIVAIVMLVTLAAAPLIALYGPAPVEDPDTITYLYGFLSRNVFAQPRHPLYGMILYCFQWNGSWRPVVGLQIVVYVGGALLLAASLRRVGFSAVSAVAFFIATLASYNFLYYYRVLVPEHLGVAFCLAGFGFLFMAATSTRMTAWLVASAAAFSLAYFLRPTFLPGVVAVPVFFFLLLRRLGHPRAWTAAAALFALMIAPYLMQSGLRKALVGDFNIVSFGGFSASGLAAQLLDEGVLDRLQGADRETGQAVLQAVREGEREGIVIATPTDRTTGKREMNAMARSYFDIYARNSDFIVHDKIKPMRGPGETWVAFDKRLASFTVAVLKAAPDRWLAWIVGALARLPGKMIVNSASNLFYAAILFCVFFLTFAQRRRDDLWQANRDTGPISVALCLVWILSWSPLLVLVAFPHNRYAATAGALIGPACLVLAIELGLRAWGRPDWQAPEPRLAA